MPSCSSKGQPHKGITYFLFYLSQILVFLHLKITFLAYFSMLWPYLNEGIACVWETHLGWVYGDFFPMNFWWSMHLIPGCMPWLIFASNLDTHPTLIQTFNRPTFEPPCIRLMNLNCFIILFLKVGHDICTK